MKNFFDVIKYSLNIIFESFVYLFHEIKTLVLSIVKGFLNLFTKKKKNVDIKSILLKNQTNEEKQHSKIEELQSKNSNEEHAVNKENLLKVQQDIANTKQKKVDLPLREKSSVSASKVGKKKFNKTKIYLLGFVFICVYMVYVFWNLPDYSSLSNYHPPQITRIYSSDSQLIETYALENRIFVPIYMIPKAVQDAFVSAEDKNFYKHSGFDYLGLLRASFNNVKYFLGLSKNIEGASTITQQVAKNFLLNNKRTLRRKMREAILTKSIEKKYSKQKILELYLNEIYLGRSSYGVSMAALTYFNKPITDVNIAEAAFLAILPKAPSSYDPEKFYNLAKARRDWVLDKMYKNNRISFKEYQQALQEPINYATSHNNQNYTLNYAKEEIRRDIIKKLGYDKLYGGGLIVQTSINANYQRYAYNALRAGIVAYENKRGYRGVLAHVDLSIPKGGYPENNNEWLDEFKNDDTVKNYSLKVYPWRVGIILGVKPKELTVGLLNGERAKVVLNDFNNWAVPVEVKDKKNNQLTSFSTIFQNGDVILVEEYKKQYLLRQIPEVNGALLAMDPQSGEIVAMQGGFSFLLSEFNRATQALRQPGSSIKPFVYLTAIKAGFKANDTVLDAPLVMDNKDSDGTWRPRNSYGVYRGFVTLRSGLEHSRNLATIRLADTIGLPAISNVLMSLNIYNSPLENFSEILGSREATLQTMVSAYAMLANGGKLITPSVIREIQDNNGQSIFRLDSRECNECNGINWKSNLKPPILEDNRVEVIDPKDAFIVVNMLEGTVQRGTGIRARIKGYKIAGKTGTTNDSKDAWFIGFSPDLVVGIYLGADNPISLGAKSEAATLAVPIFRSFMVNALRNRESLPFRTPAGIHMSWVDYKTGKPSLPKQFSHVIAEPIKDGQDVNPHILGIKNTGIGNNTDPIPLESDDEQNSLY